MASPLTHRISRNGHACRTVVASTADDGATPRGSANQLFAYTDVFSRFFTSRPSPDGAGAPPVDAKRRNLRPAWARYGRSPALLIQHVRRSLVAWSAFLVQIPLVQQVTESANSIRGFAHGKFTTARILAGNGTTVGESAMSKTRLWGLVGIAIASGVSIASTDVLACGCFAPPVPNAASDSFAVNQQAEQVIFEVTGDKVSAHVRILYSGDPEQFAWLLPMPNVPDLELSNGLLFGLIDQQTSPQVQVYPESLCPEQKYICRTHPPCQILGQSTAVGQSPASAAPDAFAAESGDAAGVAAPPVQILAQERIGSYDTITFAADEADLAVEWLNENGFIINETMSPYMQPFLDAGMVFVASKLVPGANVDEIRPLKLTYQAESASIPLQLTAIAAEPHMMVTAFIYSDKEFEPAFMPLVEIPEDEVTSTRRNNYPMLLSRVIDEEAGGAGFVKEYVGTGPVFQDPTGCCSGDNDFCGVGSDGLCQCPESEFDANDCAAQEEVVEAATMARNLSNSYPTFTRISTRVSPEEMTFNPEFVPVNEPSGFRGNLQLVGKAFTLAACEGQIVDRDSYEHTKEIADCSSMYCDYGECVTTSFGPGCACDDGFVARVFTDSDGLPSLTCVPEVGTVDFAAGGLDVPDACEGVEADGGSCVDVGGFAALDCDEGLAAALGPVIGGRTLFPACVEISEGSGGPGARNFTKAYADLDVCAPPPPSCPGNGWLEERQVAREGLDCGDGPDSSWFDVPPAPDCSETQMSTSPTPGAVAQTSSPSNPTVNTVMDTSAPRPGPEEDDATDDDSSKSDTKSDSKSGSDKSDSKGDSDDDSDDDGCSIVAVGQFSSRAGVWWSALALASALVLRRRRSM